MTVLLDSAGIISLLAVCVSPSSLHIVLSTKHLTFGSAWWSVAMREFPKKEMTRAHVLSFCPTRAYRKSGRRPNWVVVSEFQNRDGGAAHVKLLLSPVQKNQ
jgi:hypothetical protein